MQYKNDGAKRRMYAVALTMLCGAAFATPALANPSYTFKTIAATGPSGTVGAFSQMITPSINDAGMVAFYGSTFCGGANTCSGVYTIDPTGTMSTIIQGTPIATLPYQLYSEAVINHGGAISFNVQNFTVPGTSPTSNWLDLWKGGVLKQAAPTRAVTAPATMVYVGPRLLNNSKIIVSDSENKQLVTAFKNLAPVPAAPGYCTWSNGTGSSLNGWVITQGGPTGGVCTSTGFLVTNISKGITQLRVPNDGTYGQLNNATVNQASTIAFTGRNLPGRTNNEAMFQQKSGRAIVQLAELNNGICGNAPPPSGSCQHLSYVNSLATNAKGQVLANIQITTWTAGGNATATTGVALNGDTVNGQIVWPGMTINGCSVRQAFVGPRSINKYGQIALQAFCNGGNSPWVLFVATPVVP